MGSLVALALLPLWTPAGAAPTLVWDWSPVTTGADITNDSWGNDYKGQYFAEKVRFDGSLLITGIATYSAAWYATNPPTSVAVHIWSDAGGQPGQLIAEYFTTIGQIDADGASADTRRYYASIPGFLMASGTTYWIGMGTWEGMSLGLAGLRGVSGGDGRLALFNGDAFIGFANDVGDMAFRLYGEVDRNAPALSVQPGSIEFGSTFVRNKLVRTIAISNGGMQPLTIYGIGEADALEPPFEIVRDRCTGKTLNSTETCRIDVAFAPDNVGEYSDAFDIASNVPYPTQKVFVSGKAFSVGAQAFHLSQILVTCENRTSKRRVEFQLAEIENGAFDCQAAGLPVRVGDEVRITITGSAQTN